MVCGVGSPRAASTHVSLSLLAYVISWKMAAAVCVVGGLPFRMANRPNWYCTMSATACVSAAEPERQHQMVSWTFVSLSVTRFAMYAPVVVRESAP